MSSTTSHTNQDERHTKVKSSRNKRNIQIFVFGLLTLGIFGAWQFLNAYNNSTDPTVAGRPLSNTHTHLHSVVLGEKPGVFYLGTHYGLFTSTDGAHTWPQSHGVLSNYMVTSLAVSPSNPSILALIIIPTSGLGQQSGIAFSRNNGISWLISAPSGLSSSSYPYSVKAGDQALFESHDDGHHWVHISAIQGNVQGLTATNSMPRILYCATGHGFYYWQEGSARITQVTHLPMITPLTRLLTDKSGKVLYGLAGQDLWFSTDEGNSWVHRWHFERGDLISLVIDPMNPYTLYAGFFLPPEVIYSKDGGSLWQTLTA